MREAVEHAIEEVGEGCEVLRAIAVEIDSTRVRAAPSVALRAWRGLISGSLSVVDRFDHGGRRFVVVCRAETTGASRGLSAREREVLAYAALGYSNKHIAYALGLAPSTISTHLRSAMRRLGLPALSAVPELLGWPQEAERS